MSRLRRIVLLRHGETVGNSSTRFHGSGDVALSDEGRQHMREAAHAMRREVFDLVVASPLRRSWEGATIAAGGAPVRLEPDFREIHFGRWEGLTMEEIEAADPALAGEWKAKAEGFEYPGGELRATFRERVLRGLDRLDQSGASSVLAVVHKGVICTIAEHLADQTLEDGSPALGKAVSFTRSNGIWRIGRRGSDPEGLNDAA
jgi:broad specificity phosphatase PhoE